MATPMSAEKLLERGYCCGLKCKNCPYFPRHITGNKTIVNEKTYGMKTPNKHFFISSRSYTYDDQENEWKEFSDNFYFLEGRTLKSITLTPKMVKIFFTTQTSDYLADAKKLFFTSIKIFFKKK
jgi:hypothetical protein